MFIQLLMAKKRKRHGTPSSCRSANRSTLFLKQSEIHKPHHKVTVCQSGEKISP